MSQFPLSSAKKIQAKMAQGSFKISKKTILLILKLPCAILACIFFSGALRELTHSLPNKTFISTTKNAQTACFLLSLKVLFL